MTDAQKETILAMLDEVRIEVERGRIESLVVFARRQNQSHLQWLFHTDDADLCSLYGFALVALQRSILTKQDDGPPRSSPTGRTN